MSVHVTYVYVCDWCREIIKPDETYIWSPFCPAANVSLPQPNCWRMGLGENMVCQACLHVAEDAVKKERYK